MWTFDAISFSPLLGGQYTYDAWFTKKVIVTIDPALGGVNRTVDKGGISYEPLSFVAETFTALNYAALPNLLGEEATLEDGNGHSCIALLTEATPLTVVSPTSGAYQIRMTFEYLRDA